MQESRERTWGLKLKTTGPRLPHSEENTFICTNRCRNGRCTIQTEEIITSTQNNKYPAIK